mmetsp:Transcript_55045/g.91369  ORF Transcript_55045/g.91369 Transcript_55045/m.91369 type:complete len:118 (-) Transcript_55045:195-548(-)
MRDRHYHASQTFIVIVYILQRVTVVFANQTQSPVCTESAADTGEDEQENTDTGEDDDGDNGIAHGQRKTWMISRQAHYVIRVWWFAFVENQKRTMMIDTTRKANISRGYGTLCDYAH